MAHPPPDAEGRTDNELTASVPRWVKVFGIIVLVVVLLFIVQLLVGGGHSPRRHTSSGSDDGRAVAMRVSLPLTYWP